MSGRTGIDWCDATDNILTWNCTAVSPGCALCFARVHTDRYQGKGAFEARPPALRMHRAVCGRSHWARHWFPGLTPQR